MFFIIFVLPYPWIIIWRLLIMAMNPFFNILVLLHLILLLKWVLIMEIHLNLSCFFLKMSNKHLLLTYLLFWNFTHIVFFSKLLISCSRTIFLSEIRHCKFMISLPSYIELSLYIVQIRLLHRRLVVFSIKKSAW